MSKSLWNAVAVLAFALSACSSSPPPTQCAKDSDCAGLGSGYVCANTQCVESGGADSGTTDSGTTDSGTTDSGTTDSGTPDSGTADSGTPDSGTPDSGTADSGTPDSGTPDSGIACSSDLNCGGPAPVCDLGTHTCAQCTASNASACTLAQTCVNDSCAAADAGGSSGDLSTVIGYANDGGLPSGTTVNVTGPLVTYVKPSESSGDPAGFFVQAEQTGPALFVEAPAGSVAVGDRVHFTVTSAGQFNQMPVATGIAFLGIAESGHDVSPLASDVSGVDFTNTASVVTYGSRLIDLGGYVAGSVTPANTGYEQAQLTSSGVSAASNSFRLYAPTHVFTNDGVKIGCNVSLKNGILWQYFTNAEPAVWNDGELTLGTCNTLTVTGAGASSSSGVVVSFSRPVDPTTVSASSFSIPGLTVSAATPNAYDTEYFLTTSTQTAGASYTVTVASAAKDSTGIPLSAPTSASFTGYTGEATLRLTEVDVVSTSADRIELYATTAGSAAGIEIEEMTKPSVLATLPSGMNVAVGDRIVLHLDGSSCTEITARNDCPASSYANYDDAVWDVGGSAGIAFSSKVLAVLASNGTVEDAVPFTNPSLTAPSAFATTVNSLESSAQWKSMDGGTCVDTASCEGDAVDWSSTTSDFTVTAQHVATFGPTPDDRTAWFVGSASWGSFPGDGGAPVDAGTPDSGTDAGIPDSGTDAGVPLKVGEWNLEFFGKPDAGPSDDALQAQNVATVMGQTNADIWALEEVCDESRLQDVLNTLSASYGETYDVVLPDTSSVSNPYSGYGGSWGQKTALLFRTGLLTKVSADLVYNPTDTSTGASIDSSWASTFVSRDPLEVHLQVATSAGPKDLWVVVVHLKAGSGSYSQRLQESTDLKTYFDEYHPNDALMLVGDYNDDLDQSIDGTDPSPFLNFLNDTAAYQFPTKLFDTNGWNTTVSYSDAIDHHMITNELFGNLVTGSATVLHPDVDMGIANYGTTTTDHYPTVVRYLW